jgi:hypothetical protein
MKNLQDYPVSELKLIYRTLHAQLMSDTELLDSELLHDLQTWLQKKAAEEGVELTDHRHWDAWLRNKRDSSNLRAR